MIFSNLGNKSNSQDEEFDYDWNIGRSAICLLTLLSKSCDLAFLNTVIEFIGTNINNSNLINKEHGMLAFGSILETKYRSNMIDLVFSSIETIVKFLTSTNYPNSLKETTCWVLLRIAKFYGEIFETNTIIFDNMMEKIFSILKTSRRRCASLLINTILFFAKSLRNEINCENNCFSKFTQISLQTLLEFAYKPDAYDAQENIAMDSFNAIGTILQNATYSCKEIVNQFFITIQNAFEATFNIENFKSEKMRHDYQSYLSNCFFSIFSSNFVSLDYQTGKRITELIHHSFTLRNGIYEEGLLATTSLALNLGKDFEPIFKESFGNYLVFALKSKQDISLCKNAIISTSEVIRALEGNFAIYADQILPIIFDIITVNFFFNFKISSLL